MPLRCPRTVQLTPGSVVGVPEPPIVVHLQRAPGRRLPVYPVDAAEVRTGHGITGDRYEDARHRHVTVQSATALAEAAERLGRPVPAEGTRRNVTISHGDVPTAPGSLIRLGPVLLEVVRVAAPCRLLDDWLGPGAMTALRRCGGSVCRTLEGGTITLGDPVDLAASAVVPQEDR